MIMILITINACVLLRHNGWLSPDNDQVFDSDNDNTIDDNDTNYN